MNIKPLLLVLVSAACLAAAGYGTYRVGMHRGLKMAPEPTVSQAGSAGAGATTSPVSAPDAAPQSTAQGEEATRRHIASGIKAGDVDPSSGKKVLYYHDPWFRATSSTSRPSHHSWT